MKGAPKDEVRAQAQAKASLQSVAYKTVDTFAAIVKRKLFLKNGQNSRTDSVEIIVPFSDPDFYILVERHLAHVLFRSDANARVLFVKDFIAKTAEIATKLSLNKPLLDRKDVENIQEVTERVIDILESHRIESLWGMLYPGSYELLRDRLKRVSAETGRSAHQNFFDMMIAVDAGLYIPSGRMDRYKPYFVEAFKKVERRGFAATLAVARWLMTHLVNELLRESQGELPAAPVLGEAAERGAEPSDSGEPDEPEAKSGEGGKKPEPDSGSPEKSESDEGEEPGGDSGGGAEGGGPEAGQVADVPWHPPKVTATAKERVLAMQSVARHFGELPRDKTQFYSDYEAAEIKITDSFSDTRTAVETALRLNISDTAQFEEALQDSENRMNEFLEAVQKQLAPTLDHDSWLKKDAFCRLKFVDVHQSDFIDMIAPKEMSPEDRETARKLKNRFTKILGRSRTSLEETGTEIDVPAYIQRRVSKQSGPAFKHTAMGPGFKCLVLVDRSTSMQHGNRTQQVERGARILNKALEFPFVDVKLWGFRAPFDGKVVIDRFDRDVPSLTCEKAPVEGNTPLHVAVSAAARELSMGDEVKHLIILTDGSPQYANRDGGLISEAMLRYYVRRNVHSARRQGIRVTTLLIGTLNEELNVIQFDVSRKHCQYMFGSPRTWKYVDETRFAADLVQAITSSFSAYLSGI